MAKQLKQIFFQQCRIDGESSLGPFSGSNNDKLWTARSIPGDIQSWHVCSLEFVGAHSSFDSAQG